MTTLPDPIVALGDDVALWLLTYLLHSTALIAGAWVVTRLAPLEPAARDFVWRVALLGGVVTATGVVQSTPRGSEADMVGRVEVRREVRTVERGGPAALLDELRRVDSGRREVGPPGPLHWVGSGPEVSRVPAQAPEAALGPECRQLMRSASPPDLERIRRIAEVCASRAGVDWRHLLVLSWLLGAGIALIALGRGQKAVRSLGASFSPAGRRPREALEALGSLAGSVRVVESPHLCAPCAMPGRTIGLPMRCEADLGHEELRAVLAHELAHVVRRDVGWSAFLRAVVALFWLQPLNRLALRHALEATEEACDDWALAHTGARIGLATSISRVAEWASASFVDPVTVAMAGRDRGAVSRRVRRILSAPQRSESRWRRIVAALVIALPLPLLPVLPATEELHSAVWVEATDVVASTTAADSTRVDSLATRIIVARIRGD